jgi:hypothetical protein
MYASDFAAAAGLIESFRDMSGTSAVGSVQVLKKTNVCQ